MGPYSVASLPAFLIMYVLAEGLQALLAAGGLFCPLRTETLGREALKVIWSTGPVGLRSLATHSGHSMLASFYFYLVIF